MTGRKTTPPPPPQAVGSSLGCRSEVQEALRPRGVSVASAGRVVVGWRASRAGSWVRVSARQLAVAGYSLQEWLLLADGQPGKAHAQHGALRASPCMLHHIWRFRSGAVLASSFRNLPSLVSSAPCAKTNRGGTPISFRRAEQGILYISMVSV
uniref:Uncharacterized protein n=1 Tax=Oryza punctata TaxID=4537 RepID=A0A0E0LZU3_ORYPU